MKRYSFILFVVMMMGLIFAPVLPMAGQSLGSLTLTQVAPRVITPNGDGYNDVVFFEFDNGINIEGTPFDTGVYDLSGANVSSLKLDLGGNALSWDGKDSSGRVVPSGIYIYMIKLGKYTVSGTVVVAK